ncbi:retention module-containing protein [Methylophaga sp. OBS4]|uniref:retention module-containing protein n=1 Tax=Methylophaga sp. OBS4 TaxID=2991935 RepID=UPI00224DDC24|nr:retention module-containing protein [Methylophaga sp. OBS4]MCX4186909.1 retention module-containing protein [Methylophaga sp. OBS4]
MAKQIGTVNAVSGAVSATSSDGTIRNLQLNDVVYEDDLIITGENGVVEIGFANNHTMDLGRNSQVMLDGDIYDATTTGASGQPSSPDVEAIQQAVLEGEDPTLIQEATAAGAGTQTGNEGHDAVFVDYLNPEVIPEAGFDTTGVTNEYTLPEEDNIVVQQQTPGILELTVSVEIEGGEAGFPPGSPPTPEHSLLIDGNSASVIEGTSEGTKEIVFIIRLSEVATEAVEVTYQLQPVSDNAAADFGEDWLGNSIMPQTITIPAGQTEYRVNVHVVEDRIDEGNGVFQLVLLSATNANINPEANTIQVSIYDDDATPDANDDANTIYDEEGVESFTVTGNVLINDTDADQDDENGSLRIETSDDIVINHEYGTLTLSADGNYQFDLNANGVALLKSLGEEETAEILFENAYQVTDGVNLGDSANLSISLVGLNDPPSLSVNEGQTGILYEAGLNTGSNVGMTVNTLTGSFTLSDPDGNDDITHVKINNTVIDIAELGNNNLIQGQYGQLLIIDYNSETGEAIFKYNLTDPAIDIEDADELDLFGMAVSDDGINFSSPVSLQFTIMDDVPTFTIVNEGFDADNTVSLTAFNSESDQTTYDDIQLADWVLGADGFASANVTIPEGVNAQVVSQSEDSIVLNFLDGDAVVATLTLNANGSDSLQVFNREFDIETIPLLTSSVSASGPELVKYINSEKLNVTITGSDGDTLPNEPQDEVNPSKLGWAVDDNQIDVGESITFSFDRPVSDFSFAATGFTGAPSDDSIGLNITVYYDESKTDYESFSVTAESNQTIQLNQLDGFGSDLSSVNTIWAVEVESDASSQDTNDGFRLNNIVATTSSTSAPTDLEFTGITVEIEDTDGDTASQSFDLTLNGEYGSDVYVESIAGTSSDDALMGTNGDDVIRSGSGNDTITSGDGNDQLIWGPGETGTDTVTDFEQGNDVMDISQLLDPEGSLDIGGVHSLDDYLRASFDGTHTTFEVFNNGDAAEDAAIVTQTIIVTGDFTDLSTLLIDGDLVVDQS